MTDELLMQELVEGGIPKDKAGLAASRVIEKFADLCLVSGILEPPDEHAKEREELLTQAIATVTQEGVDGLELSAGEKLAARIGRRRWN